MNTLYSMRRLGNSYKVRLALAQLRIPYRLVEVDILRGEGRTPEFLAKNPNARCRCWKSRRTLYRESNAILWYLAGGSVLAAEDRITRAEALQWMFFEQHRLVPSIARYFWLALSRAVANCNGTCSMTGWNRATARWVAMENHLQSRRFRGRPLHDRGHRALCPHASRACLRFRFDGIFGGPRLAQPRGGAARPYADG